ncbi:hypothetical protein ACLK17_20885 [Escherichia coli]
MTPRCHWCRRLHDVPVPSFLEDSRAHGACGVCDGPSDEALGLPGSSFVPLIVGFGCNVPSVMGARTSMHRVNVDDHHDGTVHVLRRAS